MTQQAIPFNRPHIVGRELEYIVKAVEAGKLSGDGPFTKKCHAWLEQRIGCKRALLTHSCTAALEMSALLIDLKPGDEVIMPSYTFVSTANAFVLRGGVPVFVDVRPDTFNIDETLIEQAITPRTRGIVVVHYAGMGCAMDEIMMIAGKHNLWVVEDAAQALLATYKGRPLGSIGHLGCFSFHETKNIISGEGGALAINHAPFTERAEIIREKGTNRSRFFRGEVDKYTWVDTGSSYLPSEVTGAFLYAQLEQADEINAKRNRIWNHYYCLLHHLEEEGYIKLPVIPSDCVGNGHLFYIITRSLDERTHLMKFMKDDGVGVVFHYVPLHSSPAGMKFGRTCGVMTVTDTVSNCLLRLPLHYGLDEDQVGVITSRIIDFYKKG